MDLNRLCELLDIQDVGPDGLESGFSSLLEMFPDSSCESLQLVNLLLPLVLEILKPFYSEDAMVQINMYFYIEVFTCSIS